MLCRQAVDQIVDHRRVAQIGITLRRLQATQAPLIVSRQAILQIVVPHNSKPWHKSLMAHHHATRKALHSQVPWRSEMPAAQLVLLGIHQARLTVYHVGRVLRRLHNSLHHIGRSKSVAGIQKHNIFALSLVDGFVHGIIQAAVALAHPPQRLYAAAAHRLHSAIFRCTVNHQPLKVAAGLVPYALDGATNHSLGVVGHRGYCYQWIFAFCHIKIVKGGNVIACQFVLWL